MNGNKLVNSIWGLLFLAVCFYLLSSQLKTLYPINNLIIVLVGFFGSIFLSPRYYGQKYMLWAFLFAYVLFINFLTGDYYFERFPNVAQEVVFLLFPSALSFYIVSKKQILLARIFLYTFIAFIIYTTIASVLVDIVYPGAIRETVYLMNTENSEILSIYYMLGLSSYKLTHALPIAISPLVMMLKNKNEFKILRILCFISIISIFILIYVSYATAPMLLATLMLVLSLFVNEKVGVKANIIKLGIGFAIFLPFLLSSDLLINSVQFIVGIFGNMGNAYIDRIEDIKNMTQTGNTSGDLGLRLNKYSISISALTGNLILGSNLQTGEHSALLDRLTSLGLVGFIPYVCFLFSQVKTTYKTLHTDSKMYYIIGVVGAIMMLLTKNMSCWDTWFMFLTLLPIILWLSKKKEIKVQ